MATRVGFFTVKKLFLHYIVKDRSAVSPACRKRQLKGATCLPWVATHRRGRGDPGS